MWYHYVLFALGAVLSQFAEWTHLKVFGPDDRWIFAYLYAIAIVLVEYACSVTANRHFYNEDGNHQRGFVLQVLWNGIQQLTINLLLALWIGQKYNWLHFLSLGLLIGAVFCAAVGTYKQDDYRAV